MNSSGARTHPNLDYLSSDALGFMPWMPAARRLRRAEASVALAPPAPSRRRASTVVDHDRFG